MYVSHAMRLPAATGQRKAFLELIQWVFCYLAVLQLIKRWCQGKSPCATGTVALKHVNSSVARPVVSCCGGRAALAQEANSWDPGSLTGRDTSFDVPESSCILSGPWLQLDSRYALETGCTACIHIVKALKQEDKEQPQSNLAWDELGEDEQPVSTNVCRANGWPIIHSYQRNSVKRKTSVSRTFDSTDIFSGPWAPTGNVWCFPTVSIHCLFKAVSEMLNKTHLRDIRRVWGIRNIQLFSWRSSEYLSPISRAGEAAAWRTFFLTGNLFLPAWRPRTHW